MTAPRAFIPSAPPPAEATDSAIVFARTPRPASTPWPAKRRQASGAIPRVPSPCPTPITRDQVGPQLAVRLVDVHRPLLRRDPPSACGSRAAACRRSAHRARVSSREAGTPATSGTASRSARTRSAALATRLISMLYRSSCARSSRVRRQVLEDQLPRPPSAAASRAARASRPSAPPGPSTSRRVSSDGWCAGWHSAALLRVGDRPGRVRVGQRPRAAGQCEQQRQRSPSPERTLSSAACGSRRRGGSSRR